MPLLHSMTLPATTRMTPPATQCKPVSVHCQRCRTLFAPVASQILQYQHKMEEMQVDFAQMLRETLDRMHERLANGTFNK